MRTNLDAIKNFFAINGNWKDLPKITSYQTYFNITDKANLNNIKKNPVNFLVLYQGNSISFFYDNTAWSYTMLGKLDIFDIKEIKTFLAAGKGKTDIILSLKDGK